LIEDTRAVFVAGFNPARVSWGLKVLGSPVYVLEGRAAGHALLERLSHFPGGLALVGPFLPDFPQKEAIRRIRATPETRRVSVLALVREEPRDLPGANAVLPLSADSAALESWVSKLREVAPRVKIASRVRGRTVDQSQPFCGVTRNVSATGMRVVSADALRDGIELDLWLELPSGNMVPVLGRIVRSDNGTGVPSHGYGVEFVYVPPATHEALAEVIAGDHSQRPRVDTLKSGAWTYDVLGPQRRGEVWEVEVWRSRATDVRGERFLAVVGATAREAVGNARELLMTWVLVRDGTHVLARKTAS
jgi:hypothetical protein